MKQLSIFICLFVASFGLTAQAIVYVDADAGGTGDGATWANAYPDLNDAINAAPTGASLWLAEGTYTTPDSTSFVIFGKDLTILGGFAGNEESADAADPEANATILSGDVAGNDPMTYDSTAYSDNNRILTIIDTSSTNVSSITVTLDGLTFTHGAIAAASDVNADTIPEFTPRRSGGAILTTARVVASRLNFTANRAPYGSAVSLFNATAAGSTFDDITTARNFVDQDAILYFRATANIAITNSTFEGMGRNVGMGDGLIQFLGVFNSSVRSSTFTNLRVDAGGGAAIEAAVCDDILVEDCTFAGVQARFGTVFFGSGGLLGTPSDENDHIIRNSTFTDCEVVAGGRGSAMNTWDASALLDSVTIDGSTNFVGIGGALYLQAASGGNRTFRTDIRNSEFSNCSDLAVGGTVLALSFDSTFQALNISGTTFRDNTSGILTDDPAQYTSGSGGAIFMLQTADLFGDVLTIDDSEFTGNTATRGGAINYQSNGPLNISNSLFEENRGIGVGATASDAELEGTGGALAVSSTGDINISNTEFIANTAGGRGVQTTRGGAISFNGFLRMDDPDKLDRSTLYLDGVRFQGNRARLGGAIYTQLEYGIDVKNSVFEENGSEEDDGVLNVPSTNIGGAIAGLHLGTTSFITIDSSSFIANQTRQFDNFFAGGGAITNIGLGLQPGEEFELRTSRLTVSNSLFQDNTAGAGVTGAVGGAITLSGGHSVTIEGTDFLVNSAVGGGGAIATFNNAVLDTTGATPQLRFPPFTGSISESTFISNTTDSQGGAISTQQSVFDLTNNVFVENQVNSEGASGGAIIYNGNSPIFTADDSDPPVFTFFNAGELQLEADIVHNTFIDNTAPITDEAVGDAIAVFQPGETISNDTNTLTVNLLNNVFLDQAPTDDDRQTQFVGAEPLIATQLPTEIQPIGEGLIINSLGGNFFNAENTGELMLTDDDVLNLDVNDRNFSTYFIDPFGNDDDEFDFDLQTGPDLGGSNPLIDGGVRNALVPERDLFGNFRGETPDIGAIEANFDATGVADPIEESGLDMQFFPNPTVDAVTVRNNEAGINKFYVILSDVTGRVLKAHVFTDVNNRIDLSTAPAGIYNLQLLVNGKLYAKQIVKQ